MFSWKTYTRVFAVIVVVVILGMSFFAGVLYGYENRPGAEKLVNIAGKDPAPQFRDADFSLFWEAWSRLEEKYVDKSKLDREQLTYGAISGMVAAVKDPYTEFMPPPEAKQFQEDIKGSFGGIGAEIGIRKETLTVIAPLKNNPAEKAGVKPGDKIFKIDDAVTVDMTLEEAVGRIRGPVGTKVHLTIIREGLAHPKEFIVTRDEIRLPIIETEKKEHSIFLIRLHHFTENSGFEFRRAVREFYASGSTKLILDLRNNPGGFFTMAIDIASWFMSTGDIVAREKFADGSEQSYRSSGYQLLERIPTVVLINEGSASASEIVAGALRDNRRIKIIGTKSYGKGSVQEVIELPKKSSLKVTIAKWMTPGGTEIEGKGLEPDIKVEVTEEERAKNSDRDLVLERAIAELSK